MDKMNYYISKTIEGTFDQVIEQVTDALQNIGFGIVTTIDMQATFRQKLDVEFKPYTILGACNPNFAHKALQMEDKLGVILPCNVLVIDQGNGQIEVAAMHPAELMYALNNPQLNQLAREVSQKMEEMMRGL
ncbi:MAG: DUF302 domain-containing protein [Bacteroidales bacterium]|nr:DUF302 domain-containing protein [Bacteroidales bacterium]